MGNLLSKEEDGKKKKKGDDDELPDVYPTSRIYYDKHGNLRLDMKMKRKNIDEEIQRIMEFDSVDEEIDGSTWYIIDASWMNAWLAYTYTAQNVSPRPGPIENQRLIIWDPTAKEWIQVGELLFLLLFLLLYLLTRPIHSIFLYIALFCFILFIPVSYSNYMLMLYFILRNSFIIVCAYIYLQKSIYC
jgi:hypothetical protein